ncbi:TlpA family protein disulfide reductase [Sinomicrobium oceani]|uniref:TlpA family protein disulfide reductase n=1 Tax=Sinomicrobium oceani TaxID=1150368 RepID=UPI00227C7090|nr:TlpA disulfide reductase family protein [Sinomicrobium oceani]
MKSVTIKRNAATGVFIIAAVFVIAVFSVKGRNTYTEQEEVAFLDGNGTKILLDNLKGKVVFINFWATWCPPCRKEMPSIDQLKQQFGGEDSIVFLMVDVDGNYEKAKAFMDSHEYNLPVYIPDGRLPSGFIRGVVPTTVILDKQGEIAGQIEGGMDYGNPGMINALKKLIAE